MNEHSYWIFIAEDDQPAAGDISDLHEAEERAAAISRDHPSDRISLLSPARQPSGVFTSKVATFQNGEKVQWRWRVDFFGYLRDVDHLRLSQNSVFYEAAHSEIGPNGELRTGFARNLVRVEATDGESAITKVKSALGPEAEHCSEWHSQPAH